MTCPRYLALPLTTLAILTLTGCALIIHSSHQTIAVNSIPPGASVSIHGIQMAQTPGGVEVQRGDNITLRFEKNGFKPVDVRLKKNVSGVVWGNLALGGLVGVIVDFTTGAAYKQSPEQVSATLDALARTDAVSTESLKHRREGSILVVFREKTSSDPANQLLPMD